MGFLPLPKWKNTWLNFTYDENSHYFQLKSVKRYFILGGASYYCWLEVGWFWRKNVLKLVNKICVSQLQRVKNGNFNLENTLLLLHISRSNQDLMNHFFSRLAESTVFFVPPCTSGRDFSVNKFLHPALFFPGSDLYGFFSVPPKRKW